MKQYQLIQKYPGCKHITVGSIVEQDGDNYFTKKNFKDGREAFSQEEVENWPSYWKRLAEPLFVTEDDVQIYDSSSRVVCVFDDFSLGVYVAKEVENLSSNPWIFSSYDNATQWIKDNKPEFSRSQILNAVYKSFKNRKSTDLLNGDEVVIIKDLFLKELGLNIK